MRLATAIRRPAEECWKSSNPAVSDARVEVSAFLEVAQASVAERDDVARFRNACASGRVVSVKLNAAPPAWQRRRRGVLWLGRRNAAVH
jgi:hypothetical protein